MPKIILFLLLAGLPILFGSCKGTNSPGPKGTIPQSVLPVEPAVKPAEPIFEDIDFLMGKFDPALDSNFIQVDTKYTDKSLIFLQKETYVQFLKMREAAGKDGIELKILSATRNFDYQRGIWERKWQKLKEQGKNDPKTMAEEILLYSAMPGTSRHHWGTDMDLNWLGNSWFESGKGQIIYNWLTANARDYGFCQPYTAKGEDRPTGYEEEKWHWSYMPLAGKYYEGARVHLKDKMISGFSGSESAESLQVVKNYILGIDPGCR